MTSVAPKTLEQVQANLRNRLESRKAPFHVTDVEAAAKAIESLRGIDGENWGAAWYAAGQEFEKAAEQQESAGQLESASELYFKAYGLYHAGRYPVPNHPSKMQCYRKSQYCYVKGGQLAANKIESVTVPFDGRENEGKEVTFYVRRRHEAKPSPVVVRWSGIDTWKEERKDIDDKLFEAGFSVITMDMPGTGDAPVLVSQDGERQFVPVLDWISTQPEFDPSRVILIGMSWGGYWATKLAYMYSHRLAGVVNWAGPIHFGFDRDWLLQSQHADSYLMDIQSARARCVGGSTYETYIDAASKLSLLNAGLLDNAHPPMLLMNGDADKQQPFDDFKLLCLSGKPKSMRLFPGGHMGYTRETIPSLIDWIRGVAGLPDGNSEKLQ